MNYHTNAPIPQPAEIPRPGLQDTFVFRGPKFLYNKSVGRFFDQQTADHVAWEANGEPLEHVPEVSMTEPSLSSAIPANAQSESRKRKIKR